MPDTQPPDLVPLTLVPVEVFGGRDDLDDIGPCQCGCHRGSPS